MKAEVLSYLYKKTRENVINRIYKNQNKSCRPRDLEEAVDIGDKKLKSLPRLLCTFPIPNNIGVNLYGLYFPSPLTLASFKDDLEIIDVWLSLGLGGACIKTVMREYSAGNKRPRLREIRVNGYDCLINAMGLPRRGVEAKIKELEHSNIFSHNRPIGLSIGGDSLAEYKYNFDLLDNYLSTKVNCQFYYEINVSCPNTPEGQSMTKHPELLVDLLNYMRERTSTIIGAKFSPDATDKDLLELCKLLKVFPKTYVNLGNTSFKKCEDINLPVYAISIGGGGLSGPALYPRTLEMTRLIAPTGIPIIATGGVDSVRKVKELLDNGVSLVGMATAVVRDMYCIPKINQELSKMY